MRETIGQKFGSAFKDRKKEKGKHRIDSTGNVWVQRYVRLICAKPSITDLKVECSTKRACVECSGFLVRRDKKHQVLASLHE